MRSFLVVLANHSTGLLGTRTVKRLSDPRFPRLNHEFFWQGIFDSSSAPIFFTTFQQKTNQCRIYRLPQYRQIKHHQHLTEEESLYGGAYTRRNQSMAIHHIDEEDISDRLPWGGATEQQ